MLNKVLNVATSFWYWLALIVIGLAMEAVALVYQYAWDFGPCVHCIHVRIWLVGMMAVAGLGLWLRQKPIPNAVLHAVNGGLMFGMLHTSQQLLGTERGTIFGSCSMSAGLPKWFELDQWFPSVFGVWEACGDTPELLFGITMAEALVVFSWALLLISLALLLAQVAGIVKKAG